jgi:hypothetical protein
MNICLWNPSSKNREFNTVTHLVFIDCKKGFDKFSRKMLNEIRAEDCLPHQLILVKYVSYRHDKVAA